MSKLVYKFLSEDMALKVLNEKRLKVSLLPELNDVHDCRPILFPPSDDDDEHSQESWTEKVIDTASKRSGLLCFSGDPKSAAVWGLYAESGSGIALEFDSQKLSDGENDLGYGHNPMIIDYVTNRPKCRSACDWEIDGDYIDAMVRALYGSKSKEWEFEREVRLIMHLPSCVPDQGRYFVGFPVGALTSVILGYKSALDPVYLCRLLSRLWGENIPPEIKRAVPDEKTFSVNIEKISPPPRSQQ